MTDGCIQPLFLRCLWYLSSVFWAVWLRYDGSRSGIPLEESREGLLTEMDGGAFVFCCFSLGDGSSGLQAGLVGSI